VRRRNSSQRAPLGERQLRELRRVLPRELLEVGRSAAGRPRRTRRATTVAPSLHDQLAGEPGPQDRQRDAGVGGELGGLAAVRVGVEEESLAVEVAQHRRARIGHAVEADVDTVISSGPRRDREATRARARGIGDGVSDCTGSLS
jgi:hypothetical protein